MLKSLALFSALVIACAPVAAHADSIGGYFSVYGSDSFTSTHVTFGSATVQPAIGGLFATYIKAGDPVNFLTLPGGLPYHTGTNTPPNPPYTTGVVPIFTVTGFSGETFTFDMTSYTAIPNACPGNGDCLGLTIYGSITATGPFDLSNSGLAMGTTTLQYVSSALEGGTTTFSGQVTASPVPEPSSLALLGTGLVGLVGIARRKFGV